MHRRTFSQAEDLLAQLNLDQNWQHLRQLVDGSVLTALKITAFSLSRSLAEPVLSADDLAVAQQELQSAYDALSNAVDMPAPMRAALHSILDHMQFAIMRYRTGGIGAFWTAWAVMVATVNLAKEQETMAREVPITVWQHVERVMARVSGFATKAAGATRTVGAAAQAIEATATLLKLGGGDAAT